MNKQHTIIIIMVGHKQKSGKDTFSDFLIERLTEYNLSIKRTAFADPLKKAYAKELNISLEKLEELKNRDEMFRKLMNIYSKKHKDKHGNEWLMTVYDEFETAKKDKVDVFIVTDFRLLEEYKEFKRLEPITVNIKRHKHTTNDITETDLDKFEFDITVDNDETRTLDDLKYAAQEVAGMVETVLINKHMSLNNREWLRKRVF